MSKWSHIFLRKVIVLVVGRAAAKLRLNHQGLRVTMMALAFLLGTLSPKARADLLYSAVAVSDAGTDNQIAYPNTGRKVAVGPEGTIYIVYYGSSGGIRVARSTNRGQSFQPSVQVNATGSESEIAVDADGVVHVVWASGGSARYSRSTDSGSSFSAPTTIGSTWSSSVHLAVDAPWVYVIPPSGDVLFRNGSSGSGSFLSTALGSSQQYADVHVDRATGDVIVVTDNPTVRYLVSSDHGATFGSENFPGGSIYYSTAVFAPTETKRYLYIAGSNSEALRIDIDSNTQTSLTFGTTTMSQGRTLAVDAFGNVVDGYVSGSEVRFAVSADNGETFASAVLVDTADYLSIGISRYYGDIIAAYQSGGQIFCNVYGGLILQSPNVVTAEVTDIGTTTATGGGNVTSDGGDSVTARGVCWSTSANPTTAGSHTTDGTGTGAFTSSLTSLTPGTLYHVRAYATNSVGTSYGGDSSFTAATTATTPTVTTATIISITSTTASGGGNVTSDGGATVTARGVCWSTSANPTTAGSHTTDGTGTGAFTSSLTSLTPGTLYHVRAYATNSVGTSYGGDSTFTTLTTPTVTTTTISSITSTTASSGGNVTSDGGATVTARGVCWSTSANPTTSDSKTTDGTGTGAFTSSLTSLTPGTLYHVRAYATNSVGTSYGGDSTFTTLTTPTVTTATISSITSTTASGGGNVTSDGGATVTARGVCWSTSANPTTSDSKTTDGTGTGTFTSSLTGLSAGTLYHVRAYATNSVGTSYGGDSTFTTLTTPTVTTATITSITSTTASSGGNVTSDGGATVTARGVCWSTSANPTTSDSKTTDGTGTGAFTSSLTSLTPGTFYHVRAYATNSVGTSYGGDSSFTTLTTPTVTTATISSITSTTASSGGNVTSSGGASVTARGVCWSTSTNPTVSDSHTTNGTGTGSFTSSLTGLNPDITYYVRAYATNSVGTAYGNLVSFITLKAYTIAGYVRSGGEGVEGVVMNGLPGNPQTDTSGYYSTIVDSGSYWQVNPTANGCTFQPDVRFYYAMSSDQTDQDYTETCFSEGIDEDKDNLVPNEYQLSQNHPNPFNPSTEIKFGLPQNNHVTLRIYNIVGQEVVTLLNRNLSAGTYHIRWNGVGGSGRVVSSGIYIYRIQAGDYIQTRQMLLLK